MSDDDYRSNEEIKIRKLDLNSYLTYHEVSQLINKEIQKAMKELPLQKRAIESYEDRIIKEKLEYRNKKLLARYLEHSKIQNNPSFQADLTDFLINYTQQKEEEKKRFIDEMVDFQTKMYCLHFGEDGKYCEKCGEQLIIQSENKRQFNTDAIFTGLLAITTLIFFILLA